MHRKKAPRRAKVARYALVTSLAVHALALWWLALILREEPAASTTTPSAVRIAALVTFERRGTTAPRSTARPTIVAATPAPPRPSPPVDRPAVQRPRRSSPRASATRSGPTVAVAYLEPATRPIVSAIAAHRLAFQSRPTAPPAPTPATPAPTPSLTPPPAPTAPASAGSGNFAGLFSQNYPPALPSHDVVETLHARLGPHFRIRISIDEAGHATDVEFIQPIDDPAIEATVRAQLAGLRYVPADCNGLHCDGVLDLSG